MTCDNIDGDDVNDDDDDNNGNDDNEFDYDYDYDCRDETTFLGGSPLPYDLLPPTNH